MRQFDLFMCCLFMQCWETRVGQEMYKLTLFDLLINITVLVLVEFPRRYKSLFHMFQKLSKFNMNVIHSDYFDMWCAVFLCQDGGGQLVQ